MMLVKKNNVYFYDNCENFVFVDKVYRLGYKFWYIICFISVIYFWCIFKYILNRF